MKPCDRVPYQIRELTRIKKRTSAGRALLVSNFLLPWVDPAEHAAIAPRATVTIDLVRLAANKRVAGIYRFGCILAE